MDKDLISRQSAIDALVRAIREDPYYDSDGAGLGVCDVRVILNDLPSAQPESLIKEIIYCKDCIHHFYEGDIPYCNQIDYGYGWEDDDFCSFAERRTDE